MIMKRTSIILTAALGIGLAACANSNSQSGDGKVVNDSTEIITRVRDNESPNGCSAKRHRLSGDPVGSPDFLPSCLPPEDELPV